MIKGFDCMISFFSRSAAVVDSLLAFAHFLFIFCVCFFLVGVQGMRVGGKRVAVIPPHLGYGAKGAPPEIGPNATLIFTMELLDAK